MNQHIVMLSDIEKYVPPRLPLEGSVFFDYGTNQPFFVDKAWWETDEPEEESDAYFDADTPFIGYLRVAASGYVSIQNPWENWSHEFCSGLADAMDQGYSEHQYHEAERYLEDDGYSWEAIRDRLYDRNIVCIASQVRWYAWDVASYSSMLDGFAEIHGVFTPPLGHPDELSNVYFIDDLENHCDREGIDFECDDDGVTITKGTFVDIFGVSHTVGDTLEIVNYRPAVGSKLLAPCPDLQTAFDAVLADIGHFES